MYVINLGLIEFDEHVPRLLLDGLTVLIQSTVVILSLLQHLIQQHVALVEGLRLTDILSLPIHLNLYFLYT